MTAFLPPRAPGLPPAMASRRRWLGTSRRLSRGVSPHVVLALACLGLAGLPGATRASDAAAAAALAPVTAPAPASSGCPSASAVPAAAGGPVPAAGAQWWLASIALMVGIALRRTSA